jgi:hypothetical protein
MNSTTPKPLVLSLMQYLPLAEKIFLAGASVGLIFLFLNLDTLVLIASLIALAVIFFLSAYRPPEDVPANENERQGFQELFAFVILPKVLWIGCAVCSVGIALYLIGPSNEGYRQMLLIGGLSLISDSVIFIFFLVKGIKHIQVVTPIFFRAIPLLAASAYIWFKVMPL